MKPPRASFKADVDRLTIQDLFRAVKSAGDKYDARLMLRVEGDQDRVSGELARVTGLRAPGSADRNSVRLVTFHMDKATKWSNVVKAIETAGGKLVDLPPDSK